MYALAQYEHSYSIREYMYALAQYEHSYSIREYMYALAQYEHSYSIREYMCALARNEHSYSIKLLLLYLTIPTSISERSFYAMKRLLTYRAGESRSEAQGNISFGGPVGPVNTRGVGGGTP